MELGGWALQSGYQSSTAPRLEFGGEVVPLCCIAGQLMAMKQAPVLETLNLVLVLVFACQGGLGDMRCNLRMVPMLCMCLTSSVPYGGDAW